MKNTKILHFIVLSWLLFNPDYVSKTLISPFYYIISVEQISVAILSWPFFQVSTFQSTLLPLCIPLIWKHIQLPFLVPFTSTQLYTSWPQIWKSKCKTKTAKAVGMVYWPSRRQQESCQRCRPKKLSHFM